MVFPQVILMSGDKQEATTKGFKSMIRMFMSSKGLISYSVEVSRFNSFINFIP